MLSMLLTKMSPPRLVPVYYPLGPGAGPVLGQKQIFLAGGDAATRRGEEEKSLATLATNTSCGVFPQSFPISSLFQKIEKTKKPVLI